MVIVGDTAKARKGTSWGRIRHILGAADRQWVENCVASGLSTGEGLPARLARDADGAGRSEHRLLVQESEFARTLRVMGREGSTLSPMLRQAFDSGHLSVLTKTNPVDVLDAHISIVAHITVEELHHRLDDTEAANGFGNRFLFVATRRSKSLPLGGSEIEGQAELVKRLHDAIEAGREREEVRFDPAAEAMWIDVYEELSRGERGLVGGITARSEALVIRLALLYALLDGDDAIRKDHLAAALAAWDYCYASTCACRVPGQLSSRSPWCLNACNAASTACWTRRRRPRIVATG